MKLGGGCALTTVPHTVESLIHRLESSNRRDGLMLQIVSHKVGDGSLIETVKHVHQDRCHVQECVPVLRRSSYANRRSLVELAQLR